MKGGKHHGATQSFVFCSQIMTEYFHATFLLANKIKFIGMLLNVVNRQVHKRSLTAALPNHSTKLTMTY